MATNEVTVGYWRARGRGASIRSLLAYCGIPFNNKLYTDRNEWFDKDKQELGAEFPNLPYLIDGDKIITETFAILYYAAIKAGRRDLIGDTDEKFIKVQTAIGVIDDLRVATVKILNGQGDKEAEKKEAFTNGAIKNKLEILNKNLEGKEWVTGFLSIADFELFETLVLVSRLDPSEIDKFPHVAAFHKRFGDLPEYKAHKESAQFVDRDEKFIKVQLALITIHDLRSNANKILSTQGDQQAEKEEAFTKGVLKNKLDVLNKNLEGKEWITGFFSIADFDLYKSLNIVARLDPTQIDNYPNLAAFHKRFSELPEYKANKESPQFIGYGF